jgi:endonuclease/exonuclease/phosphatase family metal-dependent hydrolase
MKFKKRRFALFFILAFVVLLKKWNTITGLATTTNTPEFFTVSSLPRKLRVLSLNFFLRSWGVCDSFSTGDSKRERLKEFVDLHLSKYDIVLFQEVFGVFSLSCNELIGKAKKFGFNYCITPENPPFFSRHMMDNGLLILSKFPIVESETVVYQDYVYVDQMASKGFQYAKIQISGTKYLQVINTHLQADYNPFDTKAEEVKRKQLAQLKSFIDKKSNGPMIIGGDFNCNSMYRDQYLTSHLNISSQLYKDMLNILGLTQKSDLLKTLNGVRPATNHDKDLPQSIDYLFFKDNERKSWIIPIKATINSFNAKHTRLRYLSDHFGVEAEFNINIL